MRTRRLCLLLAACVAGCSTDASRQASSSVAGEQQSIIYGKDDRQELYQVEDPQLRELGRSSIVALIQSDLLHVTNAGTVGLAVPTLEQAYSLCEDQRFRQQPAAATCSGVLIDRDLIVTAGHCIRSAQECQSFSFVFDYAYHGEGQLEGITASDVYGCRRLVARAFSDAGVDYAVVQLDRLPTGRTPPSVRSKPMKMGDPLAVFGFTSGLPMKVDQGAQVEDGRDGTDDYFELNSDTFEGSSGSGIFDAQRRLVGVLVRGGEDYEKTDAGCQIARVVPANSATPEWDWEQGTYVHRAIADLCDQGYPSRALCNIAPRCGDGFCSFDPVDEACPKDCVEGACSDEGCTKSALELGVPGAPLPPTKAARAQGQCSAQPLGGEAVVGWLSALVTAGALCLRRRRRSAEITQR